MFVSIRLPFTAPQHVCLGLALLVGACDKSPAATPSTQAAPAAKTAEPAGAGANKAEAAPVKVVDGPEPGAEDRYALHVQTPEAKAGEEATVTVTVVPKAPWHMNLDFPTSIKLEAPAAVTLAKAELAKADAAALDETRCEFKIPFTPASAGEQSFTGKFKFAVCQDEACAPVTEDLEFKVAVK